MGCLNVFIFQHLQLPFAVVSYTLHTLYSVLSTNNVNNINNNVYYYNTHHYTHFIWFLPLRPLNNGDGNDPKWGGRKIGLDIAGSDTGLNPFLLTK